MIIETVKVVKGSERGWHIINKCDFDPEKHKLYEEPKEKPVTKKKAE